MTATGERVRRFRHIPEGMATFDDGPWTAAADTLELLRDRDALRDGLEGVKRINAELGAERDALRAEGARLREAISELPPADRARIEWLAAAPVLS